MNVDVICNRKVCQTRFVTGFDSLVNREVHCPKCREGWAVHMIDESGNLIHPTEICPLCSKPALLIERCRCSRYCIKCVNDHEWHTCTVHKIQTPGSGHSHPQGCSCKIENP